MASKNVETLRAAHESWNRRCMSLPFCEICQFDKQGRIVSSGCYYDQYTLLTQLGHVSPLAAAA